MKFSSNQTFSIVSATEKRSCSDESSIIMPALKRGSMSKYIIRTLIIVKTRNRKTFLYFKCTYCLALLLFSKRSNCSNSLCRVEKNRLEWETTKKNKIQMKRKKISLSPRNLQVISRYAQRRTHNRPQTATGTSIT